MVGVHNEIHKKENTMKKLIPLLLVLMLGCAAPITTVYEGEEEFVGAATEAWYNDKPSQTESASEGFDYMDDMFLFLHNIYGGDSVGAYPGIAAYNNSGTWTDGFSDSSAELHLKGPMITNTTLLSTNGSTLTISEGMFMWDVDDDMFYVYGADDWVYVGGGNGGSITPTYVSGVDFETDGTMTATRYYGDASYMSGVAGSGNVSATGNFGTDNGIVTADDVYRDVQGTAVTIDDSDNMIVPGDFTVYGTPYITETYYKDIQSVDNGEYATAASVYLGNSDYSGIGTRAMAFSYSVSDTVMWTSKMQGNLKTSEAVDVYVDFIFDVTPSYLTETAVFDLTARGDSWTTNTMITLTVTDTFANGVYDSTSASDSPSYNILSLPLSLTANNASRNEMVSFELRRNVDYCGGLLVTEVGNYCGDTYVDEINIVHIQERGTKGN